MISVIYIECTFLFLYHFYSIKHFFCIFSEVKNTEKMFDAIKMIQKEESTF